MIGEMRDLETARIAIQSALTGHLVLSTLHTNNAAGGITRMLDMGVEDYLLTSTVNGILAQRLVRRLEPTHAERYRALAGGNREVRAAPLPARGRRSTCIARAVRRSHPTGYQGRTHDHGIHGDERRAASRRSCATPAWANSKQLARNAGMRTMYEDGIVKALAGVTTIEEVLRVTEDA